MSWLSRTPVTKVSTAKVGIAPAASKEYYICQCGGIGLLAFIIHFMSSHRLGSVTSGELRFGAILVLQGLVVTNLKVYFCCIYTLIETYLYIFYFIDFFLIDQLSTNN